MNVKPEQVLVWLFTGIKLLLAVCIVGVLLQQFGVRIPAIPVVNPLNLIYLAGAFYAISH